MNKIEEYKQLLIDLWKDLSDDLITDDEYINKKHDWLMENGSDELFNYFINLYKGRPIEKEYIKLKGEIMAKDQKDVIDKKEIIQLVENYNVVGAIIGDINGSVYEFNNISTKNFELFNRNMYYTDDSVLTIAVMRTFNKFMPLSSEEINNVEWQERFKKELINNFVYMVKKYPFAGYGGMFYDWTKSRDGFKPYDSWGNGAAMRVSPVGWVAETEEEVKILSRLVTEVTHNHPEGIKGAEATALAVFLARNQKIKRKDIVDRITKDYYPEIATFDYENLRKNYVFNESCQGTVPQAIFCFGISKSFEDCIRTTISIGGDCDTSAAISCAVAGAYDGISKQFYQAAMNFLPDELKEIIEEFEILRKHQ